MRSTLRLLPAFAFCFLAGTTASDAAFTVVSDFNSLTGGGAALDGQGGWTAGTRFTVVADPANASNQVALATMANGTSQAAYAPLGANSIADGTIGTLFYRTRRGNTINISAGLTDVPAPALTGNFPDFETQLNNQANSDFLGRNGGGFTTAIGPAGSPTGNFLDNAWISVWMVANNTSDTYQIYMDTGAGQFLAETGAGLSTFTFRNSGGGVQSNALVNALFTQGSTTATGLWYIDDVYIDNTGRNLANPVPEPAVPMMCGIFGVVALLRRRR